MTNSKGHFVSFWRSSPFPHVTVICRIIHNWFTEWKSSTVHIVDGKPTINVPQMNHERLTITRNFFHDSIYGSETMKWWNFFYHDVCYTYFLYFFMVTKPLGIAHFRSQLDLRTSSAPKTKALLITAPSSYIFGTFRVSDVPTLDSRIAETIHIEIGGPFILLSATWLIRLDVLCPSVEVQPTFLR